MKTPDVPVPGKFCDACGEPAYTGPMSGNEYSVVTISGERVCLCREHWNRGTDVLRREIAARRNELERLEAERERIKAEQSSNRFRLVFEELDT